jgi:uncharacterized protein
MGRREHRGVSEALKTSENRKARGFLANTGENPSLTVDEVRERLAPVFRRYNISKAVVFGSVARGEPSPHSDVDLILVQRTEKRFLDRYEGLLMELNQAIPRRTVEALIYTPEELESIRHRRFIATALSEGQVIYESG